MNEVNTKRQLELEEHPTFEILIAQLSSKFINLPAADVDQEIIDAQSRLCLFLDVDAIVLWQAFGEHADDYLATHAFQLQGGAMPSPPFRQEDFPWVRGEMDAGRIVMLATLDDMPEEAAKDKESAREFGIRSSLTIPLFVGGGLPIGVLAFNAMERERAWPQALVKRLELVAQIFANALARKRADLALRESELRLSMATDSADAGLWVLDWSSGVFWANEKARGIFGYSPDELIDMARFEASVFPEDWLRVKESMVDSVKTGAPVDVEYRIKLVDQTVKWIVSRGRPFFQANGAPERLLGLSMDITERKRAAEAFRAAEEEAEELRGNLTHLSRVNTLGALSGSLAHELNQPLGIILSNAEAAQELLLQDPPDVAEVQAILADIIAADRRAGEVIGRLRALLKRGETTLIPLALNQVIEEVVHLLRADLIARGVTVACELAPGLPPVAGDRVQLQQLVLNLILNAADAMEDNPPEERRVHLQTLLRDGRVRASVRDEGTGFTMAPEHLFQSFYTTKAKGLGLGLSICWSIVAAHHGQLWAELHSERGAVFLFELPLDGTLENA
jgi:PAS domain S-box-containing protein